MSGISSTLRINMGPAMNELCALEKSCPIAIPSSSQQAHGLARYTVTQSFSTSSTASNSLASRPLVAGDYPTLIGRLKEILKRNLAPAAYEEKLVRPFLKNLEVQGKEWFAARLTDRERPIERIAHSILQNFDPESGDIPLSTTKAVREAISDIYQVFLHNNCQLAASAKCLKTPSPLPNWYQEGLTTYPHPLESLGAMVSIVNVPARYASKSAISWGCLGHEVAGHDILGAFPGALDEIKAQLQVSFAKADLSETMPYWDLWLEEAAADVLGILNMGPAGALSQIAFLRTLGGKEAFKLSSQGYANDDPHPIDLVRGYLAAFTVEHISTPEKRFDRAAQYAQLIRAEVDKDAAGIEELTLGTITVSNPEILETHLEEFCQAQKLTLPDRPFFCLLTSRTEQLHEWVASMCKDTGFARALANFFEEKKVPQTRAAVLNGQLKKGMVGFARHMELSDFKKSAEIVAKTIMHAKLKALGGKSFHQIKSWTNQDEKTCIVFQRIFSMKEEMTPAANYTEGYFASHVVAAAILESVCEKGSQKLDATTIQQVFKKMVAILQAMHRSNPEWQLSSSAQVAPSQAVSSLSSSSLGALVGGFLNDPKRGKENRPVEFRSASSISSSTARNREWQAAQTAPSAASSSVYSAYFDPRAENRIFGVGYGNASASSSSAQRKPGLYARNGQ